MRRLYLLLASIFVWAGSAQAAKDDGFLDQPIVAYNETARDQGFLYFCEKVLKRPCGLELAHPESLNTQPLQKSNITPREILDEMAKERGSKWRILRGVVTMEPVKRLGEDFLSRKLDPFVAHQASSIAAALDAFDQAGVNVSYQEMGHRRRFGIVDVDLKGVTLREALNEIAKADGQLSWAFAPSATPGSKRNGTLIFFSERMTGGVMASDEFKKTRRWNREHKEK